MASIDSLNYDIVHQISLSLHSLLPPQLPLATKGLKPEQKWPLVALSMTSRRMRELCAPLIFRFITANTTWVEAIEYLQYIALTTRVLEHVQGISINITREHDSECPDYDGDCLVAWHYALDILCATTRLKDLSVRLSGSNRTAMSYQFRRRTIILPFVQTLAVSFVCDILVAACPNAESVALFEAPEPNDIATFMDQISPLNGLRHLEINTRWNRAKLEAVLLARPTLRSLGVMGKCDLQSLIEHISLFQHLDTLLLPEPLQPPVGFVSHNRIVRASFSTFSVHRPIITETARQKARDDLIAIVERHMRCLTTLRIGPDYSVELPRGRQSVT